MSGTGKSIPPVKYVLFAEADTHWLTTLPFGRSVLFQTADYNDIIKDADYNPLNNPQG